MFSNSINKLYIKFLSFVVKFCIQYQEVRCMQNSLALKAKVVVTFDFKTFCVVNTAVIKSASLLGCQCGYIPYFLI